MRLLRGDEGGSVDDSMIPMGLGQAQMQDQGMQMYALFGLMHSSHRSKELITKPPQ